MVEVERALILAAFERSNRRPLEAARSWESARPPYTGS